VRWIVNTHYHPDHRGGNSVVGPDAVVISTYETRMAVLRSVREESAEAGQKAVPEYQLNEVFLSTHGPTLFVGGHEVQIYHPGPAHTLGDAVVYFPDQHAIATGDLFLTNSHFEVATRNELQRFRNYLADLRDQVARMRGNGVSLERIQKLLVLSAYKGFRQFPKYEATFKDNAAAYYSQLEHRGSGQLRKGRPAK
jgi:glyoxylase-like metal-dependent hydrolase (beta-lactamase superfamily II)